MEKSRRMQGMILNAMTLSAFKLNINCMHFNWHSNAQIEKKKKKSCRTIVYSPKYMIRQVQVIYCKAYNKKRRFHRIAYAILVPILLFCMYVYVCASACMRTCSRNCSIRFSNGHEKLRTFKHKPMLDACPNV